MPVSPGERVEEPMAERSACMRQHSEASQKVSVSERKCNAEELLE